VRIRRKKRTRTAKRPGTSPWIWIFLGDKFSLEGKKVKDHLAAVIMLTLRILLCTEKIV
jgi:hypothetical protein